jgi:hypothetical protein
VVTLCDTHAFSESTSATVLAGPRYTDGSTDLEFLALLRQTFAQGEYSVNYSRTQTVAIGLAGIVETESVGASVLYSPEPFLEFRVLPTYAKSTRANLDADVYRMDFEVVNRQNRYWSIIGAYQFSLQRGALDAPRNDDKVVRNVVLLGVAFTPWPKPREGTRQRDDGTNSRETLLPRIERR